MFGPFEVVRMVVKIVVQRGSPMPKATGGLAQYLIANVDVINATCI